MPMGDDIIVEAVGDMEPRRADNITMMMTKDATSTRTVLPVAPTRTEVPSTSTEIEQAHVANDDNIILQGCPPVSQIFCDPVNAFAEILSFEADDADLDQMPSLVRINQTSPHSTMGAHAVAPQPASKQCMTPRSDQACQRRGRFLVWPASLVTPPLTHRESIDA